MAATPTPPRASAISPAELASAAYVSPAVDAGKRRRGRRSFSIPLMPLVALTVMAICGVIIWQFVVKERFRPDAQSAAPPPSTPSAPAATAATVVTNRGTSAPAQQPPSSGSPQAASRQPDTAPRAAIEQRDAPTVDGYTIQVMSAKDEAATREVVERLKSAGADAYVMRADLGSRGIWYRCRLGKFASRSEAQGAGAKLVSSGRIQSFIIVPYVPGT